MLYEAAYPALYVCAKAHQTGATNSHELIVMPTQTMTEAYPADSGYRAVDA